MNAMQIIANFIKITMKCNWTQRKNMATTKNYCTSCIEISAILPIADGTVLNHWNVDNALYGVAPYSSVNGIFQKKKATKIRTQPMKMMRYILLHRK